jgi:hypothetical protein
MYSAGLIPARCAFRQIFARTSAGRLSVGRIVSWIVRSGDMVVGFAICAFLICRLQTQDKRKLCNLHNSALGS